MFKWFEKLKDFHYWDAVFTSYDVTAPVKVRKKKRIKKRKNKR
tara:strand:+ start:54 stop:182 length:129 start_codon:yes stop_codon:yes gene_type:complete